MHKDMLPPGLLLLAQIYTKSFVGWGFAQGPTGELIALPRPLAGLGGGAPGKGKEGGEGKRREGREEKGREGVLPECPTPELASLTAADVMLLLSTALQPSNRCSIKQ